MGLIISLLSTALPSTQAFTFGCKKAQREASSYLASAFSAQDSEINYLQKRNYSSAFSSFQYGVKWFESWRKIVDKSPKCFQRNNYFARVKVALKGFAINQTMALRYGIEIAKRNNWGSPDPCFVHLGNDQRYYECRIEVGERSGPDYDYGP